MQVKASPALALMKHGEAEDSARAAERPAWLHRKASHPTVVITGARLSSHSPQQILYKKILIVLV